MNHSTTATATVLDPICGMTIDPEKAAGSSSYNGETYYFCSRGCEAKFDAAPALYVGSTPEPAAAGSCCSAPRPAAQGGHCC